MHFVADVIWFLLPAGAANLIPPVAAKWFPRWDTSVDFGTTFRGRRIFGPHKTIRGLAFGILFSSITLFLQCLFSEAMPALKALQVGPSFCDLWWLGPLFGFAALFGDLAKSFFKRQFNIEAGRSWFPWDQVDWIIGVLIATYPIFEFNLVFAFTAVALGLVSSFAAKVVGYWIGVNSDWI